MRPLLPGLNSEMKLKALDTVLFVTPEYNAECFPGVLKNALDVGSRPLRTKCLVWKTGWHYQ